MTQRTTQIQQPRTNAPVGWSVARKRLVVPSRSSQSTPPDTFVLHVWRPRHARPITDMAESRACGKDWRQRAEVELRSTNSLCRQLKTFLIDSVSGRNSTAPISTCRLTHLLPTSPRTLGDTPDHLDMSRRSESRQLPRNILETRPTRWKVANKLTTSP